MNIDIRFAHGIAVFTGSGELRPAEVHATLSKYLESANREDDLPTLWDLRGTDLGRFTHDELRILLELWIPHIHRQAPRVAIVVKASCEQKTDAQWRLGLEQTQGQERRVFSDLAEATRWLQAEIHTN